VPEGTGGIAAILGLDEAKLMGILEKAAQGEVVEPANLNSPHQIVIAGHRSAVERAMALAKEAGAKKEAQDTHEQLDRLRKHQQQQ